jgi:hypothetical protein
MGDVEWTKVVVKGIVEESVVYSKEYCLLLSLWCLGEEG